jgi:hypothetical protein
MDLKPKRTRRVSLALDEHGQLACAKCKRSLALSMFSKGKGTFGVQTTYKQCALLRPYGMSTLGYIEMYDRQKGHCGICDQVGIFKRPDGTLPMDVDHDHVTGKVRGLLCGSCNRALGFFGDSVDGLLKAVSYLQAVPA